MKRVGRSRQRAAVRAAGLDPRRDLARGRAAHARRAWEDAHATLSRADRAAPLAAADLERLAWSAILTGRSEEFLALLERLYSAHVEAGDDEAAARAAFWIGFRLYAVREAGRAGGWIARAQRLVERAGRDSVVRGYLSLPAAQRGMAAGDYPAAFDAASRAAEAGERFGDRDLTAFARNVQGCALLKQGRVREGMALIDEAMVAVTGGELSPVITGLIYCIAITHCQQVYALDRAREWAASLAGWCDAQPQLTSFTGACQVHRAEIKQLAGAWPEAIEEARRVAEHPPRSAEPDPSGDAFYQQGEVHRLRGDLAEAEAAYRRASQAGRDPQPGLALLRLSQGRRDEAASGIRRALGATSDPLLRARLLPTSVEVELAVGKVEEARAACGELEGIAARFDTEVLAAMAAHARGEVLLAEGDAGAALGPLRRAFAGWQRAAMPYVTGRVRVLLGLACRALGDRDGSTLELEAARSIFERLGAAPELARMDSEGRGEKARAVGLTPRELEVLRLVAAGKTNKDIARQLFLSGKTIDRHVSNIFLKASVSSRAAATAFAYKNKLV